MRVPCTQAFISLEDDDLIDIGVDTLGARRRIMRAVLELRNALAAPEPPEEEHEDDFDPPEYERAEQEGTAPLKEGHQVPGPPAKRDPPSARAAAAASP